MQLMATRLEARSLSAKLSADSFRLCDPPTLFSLSKKCICKIDEIYETIAKLFTIHTSTVSQHRKKFGYNHIIHKTNISYQVWVQQISHGINSIVDKNHI